MAEGLKLAAQAFGRHDNIELLRSMSTSVTHQRAHLPMTSGEGMMWHCPPPVLLTRIAEMVIP